jgi:hypothetical protein
MLVGPLWGSTCFLLVILTVVNIFSYKIVLFQLESLWTRISGARQRMPKVLGNGGDDSLVHEANPDQPHVGGVNPSLFTGDALIRNELSALFVSDIQDANKK